MLLLFTLGFGLSQSRFPPRDSWIRGWSPLVCSIGLRVSMLSDETGSKEMLDVMWRLAAVGRDVEASILLYSALIGVYNILILTGRGWNIPSWLFGRGRSSNTILFSWSLTALLTASVWIAWSVAFLLSANIIGFTVLRRLVNSVFFTRLLGVSLVVIECHTFSGSRHLAKYCADSGSECSLTFSISAYTCRWSTLDILWQPVAIPRASFCVYWMFL